MKLLSLLTATGFAVVGMAAAAANAFSVSGTVYNSQSGLPVPYAPVQIYNQCTDSYGSTNANSSGAFSFGGVVQDCTYDMSSDICQAHSDFYGWTEWLQPDNNVNEDIYDSPDGVSC